jgi:phenylpropionate dioxygenase-like ring-hydroxylating dioxygenase large terminal subunit
MSAGNATIDSARTPLASFYTDPEQLTRESRTVLPRSWQYVGHTGQLRAPGSEP